MTTDPLIIIAVFIILTLAVCLTALIIMPLIYATRNVIESSGRSALNLVQKGMKNMGFIKAKTASSLLENDVTLNVPEVPDWENVKKGTKIKVSESGNGVHIWNERPKERYLLAYLPNSDKPFVVAAGGATPDMAEGVEQWRYAEIIEEPVSTTAEKPPTPEEILDSVRFDGVVRRDTNKE